MDTKGFACGYSGAVTLDSAFPNNLSSTYISVQVAGDIVYVNTLGQNQWWPNAFVGYNPIGAIKILTSGVVDGVSKSTSATGLAWMASGKN